MDLHRSGSRPSTTGPSTWFTGDVRVTPLFEAPAPARVRGASVTFEPGARTHWHTHPLGQTLIITAGTGWAQTWPDAAPEPGPLLDLHPGDVLTFAPNEKHWHGATPTTALTHTAIQEALDGTAVTWLEPVTDTQYRR